LYNFAFCTPFSTATYKAGIYEWATERRPYFRMMDPYPPPVFVIPGLKVGCMPYDAFIESTLECFFSATCLNNTARWISSLSPSAWPKPLDSSSLIEFSPNTSMRSILDKQLMDRLHQTTNFSDYFTACTPIQCTYIVEQTGNFIYVITVLVGLYGGLIVVVRFISPFIVKLGHQIYQQFLHKTPTNIPPTQTEQGNVEK
jgi:hypothetical protein